MKYCHATGAPRPGSAPACREPSLWEGEVLLRRVGTLRYFLPPSASVQWQPDGLIIHTKKWFLGAGLLGAPPIVGVLRGGRGGFRPFFPWTAPPFSRSHRGLARACDRDRDFHTIARPRGSRAPCASRATGGAARRRVPREREKDK